MTHALNRPARSLIAVAVGAALVAVGITAAPQPAHAAVFSVTTTADTVDAAGSCLAVTPATLPGADGLVSLREAVCAANRNPGADVISLPAGTYTLTGAAGEDYAASGDLDIWDDPFGGGPVAGDGLTITGSGAGSTIIDGAGLDRVFDVLSFTPFTFTVSDVTLRGGDAGSADGGAIQTGFGAATEVYDVVIESSSAANGGAIANIQGDLTVFGTVIRGNTATGASGLGGGVFSVGPLLMQATTVSGNTAAIGGGLALESDVADVSTIEQSTISDNRATTRGGGIATTTFHAGQTVVTDTTIVGNSADVDGGAVSMAGATAGELVLSSTTVTGNTSAGTGGISRTLGAARVQYSIVAENSTADVAGTWTGSGNIVGIAGGGIVDGVSGNRAGTALAPLDPQLRALGTFGASTEVRVPLPGSIAIDTGIGCGAVDQRGIARVIGTACDVGAVELTTGPDTTITSGPATTSTTTSATFAFAATGGTGPYTYECSLGGGAYTSCTGPATVSGLAEGAQTYAVRAIDSLGATDPSAADYAWTVSARLAAAGPAGTAALLAGAGMLLLSGLVLLAARRRSRQA